MEPARPTVSCKRVNRNREARTIVAHVADYSVSFTLVAVSKAAARTPPQKGRIGLLRCQSPAPSNPPRVE